MREYLIDTIFPKREVHLLAGSSGAGKTRLLFQWLEEWTLSRPILGYESVPTAWLYVSADRSIAGTHDTLDSIKSPLSKDHSKFHSLVTGDQTKYPRTTSGLMALCKDKLARGGVAFVDGFQSLCPGGKVNDYNVVAEWLAMMTRHCTAVDLTIIGLAHASKTKKNEEYSNPRQRIMGNNAWGAYSETVIVLDTPEPEKQPNGRRLYVYPRQGAPIILPMEFNKEGRLEEGDAEIGAMAMDAWVHTQESGVEFTSKQAQDYGYNEMGIARATVFRWIGSACGRGLIRKVRHGVYSITFKN
jgi:hypothetical protein